ncbi:hypothetical protein [Occultella kanbiaonis]|uniref:hypothetical protein n=1 Tax=Occultella kanbiaonis TaxID=2675754 RepID=UPI00143DF065|nr:hypothetical protein [Occultella kanbiaonis]
MGDLGQLVRGRVRTQPDEHRHRLGIREPQRLEGEIGEQTAGPEPVNGQPQPAPGQHQQIQPGGLVLDECRKARRRRGIVVHEVNIVDDQHCPVCFDVLEHIDQRVHRVLGSVRATEHGHGAIGTAWGELVDGGGERRRELLRVTVRVIECQPDRSPPGMSDPVGCERRLPGTCRRNESQNRALVEILEQPHEARSADEVRRCGGNAELGPEERRVVSPSLHQPGATWIVCHEYPMV